MSTTANNKPVYFKITKSGRKSKYNDDFVWPAHGKWAPPVAPKLCSSGYHLFTFEHIWTYIQHGTELWVADGKGMYVESEDKIAFEQARLVRRVPGFTPANLALAAQDIADSVEYLSATNAAYSARADANAARMDQKNKNTGFLRNRIGL